MKGLIITITTLTLLIFIALGLVVYGFAREMNTAPSTPATLTLPKGAIIQEMTLSKALLALRIKTPKIGEEIIFVDIKTGETKRKLSLQYTP